MSFETFRTAYGKPRIGSGAELEALGLADSSELSTFVTETGAGIFAAGLLSVASLREAGAELAGWEAYVPASARLFASTAFGMLFFSADNRVWIIETHYGSVTETDQTVADTLTLLTEPQIRESRLRESLFREWNAMAGPLTTDCVLCPRPALALGGHWHVSALSQVTQSVYLSFSFSLFHNEHDSAVIINRATNDDIHP